MIPFGIPQAPWPGFVLIACPWCNTRQEIHQTLANTEEPIACSSCKNEPRISGDEKAHE